MNTKEFIRKLPDAVELVFTSVAYPFLIFTGAVLGLLSHGEIEMAIILIIAGFIKVLPKKVAEHDNHEQEVKQNE